MARLIDARCALADPERLTDFLRPSDTAAAVAGVDLIAEAVDILRNHPLIGRPVEAGTAA